MSIVSLAACGAFPCTHLFGFGFHVACMGAANGCHRSFEFASGSSVGPFSSTLKFSRRVVSLLLLNKTSRQLTGPRYPALTAEARGESNSRQSILRLEQPLWTGGRIEAGIEAAQLSQQVAEQSKLEAEQGLLEQTAISFYDVLRWQARMQLAEGNLEEHRRLFDLIRRRADAEISPMSDTLLAQARLQQAMSDLLLAQKTIPACK